MLPSDLTLPHAAAILLLVATWFGHGALLALFGRRSLNSQLAVVRRIWMSRLTGRPAKPFDGILLGHIVNAVSFFASATLIVLAGLLSTFATVKNVHETATALHFTADKSLELFALDLAVVTLVIALCFFSFTYALRKLIYALALIGALPEADENDPAHDELVDCATTVLTEAIQSLNFGIRGFYYFAAGFFLFISPTACMLATLLATSTLIWRQIMTPTSQAIQRYVDATGRPKV